MVKSREEKHQNIAWSKVIDGIKSRDVIELIESLEGTKLTLDRLYYYERTGLIVPSIKKSTGKGTHRLYSVEDVIALRWLVSLQKRGFSVQRYREVIEYLKKKIPEILQKPQNWVLITDSDSVRFFDKLSSKALDVIDGSGQYLLVFPVGKEFKDSEQKIKKQMMSPS
ncbi:MAG: MerR family transcriptional regulator [Candidatus Dadabacteria bacterium]|nr:MerR family transcriptional regulator [Candidatus Dadabacteria bacterium]